MGRAHRGELVIGVENDADSICLPTDDDGRGVDPKVLTGEIFQAFHREDKFQPFQIVNTDKELNLYFGRHRKGVGGFQEGAAGADIGGNRIDYRQLVGAVSVGDSGLEVEGKSFLGTFVAGHCYFSSARRGMMILPTLISGALFRSPWG
jgi:hypothetical protein